MSSVLLPFALLGTFGAIMMMGIAVESALASKRRAVRLLESQVGDVPVDLRERELQKSFLDRAMVPIGSALGGALGRLTPMAWRERISKKLVLGGSPKGWDAEKVAAFKIIGGVCGAAVGFTLTRAANMSGTLSTVIPIAFAMVFYLMPGAMLGQAAAKRQDSIRKALPDTMDLLTISVEAGLGFDAALAQVTKNVPGPLSEEISRMLQEMQLGVSRVDAFRHLSDRTDVDELRGFVLAMIQADKFGISIANVLRAQAKELRMKRRQRAERKAMTSPLKLLFPMIFCVLPSLFVVVLGPGIVRLLKDFFGFGG